MEDIKNENFESFINEKDNILQEFITEFKNKCLNIEFKKTPRKLLNIYSIKFTFNKDKQYLYGNDIINIEKLIKFEKINKRYYFCNNCLELLIYLCYENNHIINYLN